MRITCSEHTFQNSRNLRIHYLHWHSPKTPVGIINIAHGIGEHIGRYHHLGTFFAEQGFEVYGVDHQGHGKSEGKRGHVNSIKDFADDMEQLYTMVKPMNPIPYFILGHSMGGLISCAYMLNYADHLTGAILSAPALQVKMPVSSAKKKLAILMSKIAPSVTMKNEIDPVLLSRNKTNVQNYVNDPLVHPYVSMSLARDLLTFGDTCLENIPNYKTPVLLLFGDQDEIVDIYGTKTMFDQLSNPNKKMIIFNDMYHEIFNEDDHQLVFDAILDWVKSILDW